MPSVSIENGCKASIGALLLALAFGVTGRALADPQADQLETDVPVMVSERGVVRPVDKLLRREDQPFADWL